MKELVLIKNDESDLLGFYLNLYALKIIKTNESIKYIVIYKEEAYDYINRFYINEFPVLLLIENDILIDKVYGFGFLNKIPAF